jgi:hypothetical protein
MRLDPPPYHRDLATFLESEMHEVWKWFGSSQTQRQQLEHVRLDLLKTTYRLDSESSERLYGLARKASEALGLTAPVTLYQSQRQTELNASLVALPGEAHIVLHGPVTDLLNEDELLALLGHELTHLLLWTGWDGRFLVLNDVLAALTNDPGVAPAHLESARLHQLYTEVFCDRGGLLVCGNLQTAVATLIKTGTGLKEVSPEMYLQQADEVLSSGPTQTEGISHPECFIRAKALQLWASEGVASEAAIRDLIEGQLCLDGLDVLGQSRLRALTRRVIDEILSPVWMRTETNIGHARLFFEDYSPADSSHSADEWNLDLDKLDESLRTYLCYVLLDFCTTDRDLEEAPLAAAIRLAGQLHVDEAFEQIARKELNLRKKQYDTTKSSADQLIAQAEQAAVEAS